MMKKQVCAAAVITLALGTTAACGGSGGSTASGAALTAHGPVKVWLSNDPDEITWGHAMVKAWNAAHPKEVVTAQQIPAGKTSEEVIGAAITAGNAPCLVYNTSPSAVPGFQKQGGLVALDSFPDGKAYIQTRSAAAADQYKSPDGKFYQLPWKSNPVMIFYNKDMMKKAGIDPSAPPLSTSADFLATSKKIVASGAAKAAIGPAPTSEFFQSWFDFYPPYAAESGGGRVEGEPRLEELARGCRPDGGLGRAAGHDLLAGCQELVVRRQRRGAGVQSSLLHHVLVVEDHVGVGLPWDLVELPVRRLVLVCGRAGARFDVGLAVLEAVQRHEAALLLEPGNGCRGGVVDEARRVSGRDGRADDLF